MLNSQRVIQITYSSKYPPVIKHGNGKWTTEISGFPNNNKTSIQRGFAIAMFDYKRVFLVNVLDKYPIKSPFFLDEITIQMKKKGLNPGISRKIWGCIPSIGHVYVYTPSYFL